MKYLILLTVSLLLSGCFNADNAREIDQGSVSLGQQMIDLKVALDQDAISDEEYAKLKEVVMSVNSSCDEEEETED